MGHAPASGRDIVVVGASAGGVEALQTLVSGLPEDLPAAVLVVLHLPTTAPSALPRILDRAGPLPARHAQDGDPLTPGQIYVAAPGRHLVLEGDRVRLEFGARENNHRPAIDPLFRSAALAHGNRVVAVILSGTLDDGAAGTQAVTRAGGVAVVQDPDGSPYPQMALNAIAADDPDHVVPLDRIAGVVASLVWDGARVAARPDRSTADPAGEGVPPAEGPRAPLDEPAAFGCPECGGALLEVDGGGTLRFRCRVGHAYNTESLDEAQAASLEAALWSALRALDERAELAQRVAQRLTDEKTPRRRERYLKRAQEAGDQAALIRDVLRRGLTAPPERAAL